MARDWRRVHAHPYIDDGVRDSWGHTRCVRCGLPRGNRHHEVNEARRRDQREADARRLGEYEGDIE